MLQGFLQQASCWVRLPQRVSILFFPHRADGHYYAIIYFSTMSFLRWKRKLQLIGQSGQKTWVTVRPFVHVGQYKPLLFPPTSHYFVCELRETADIICVISVWKFEVCRVTLFQSALLIIPLSVAVVRGQTAAVHEAVRTERAQELDRVLIQQLQERCEQQDLQLQSLQAQLKKASLCLDVFSITTQHFCLKVGYSSAPAPRHGKQTWFCLHYTKF